MRTIPFSTGSRVSLVVVLTIIGALSIGLATRTATAQDSMMMSTHPAHLHVGTCEAPGDVVYPLTNVGFDYATDGTPMAGAAIGATSAIPVESSQTTVAVSLADIAAGGHTLVVHESDANIQNYIACGDVGGTLMGESDLAFGLGPLNDSGYGGAAWLHDNGDGTTMVTIFLTGAEMGMDMGMSGSDEDQGDHMAMGSTATVAIEGFAFNPATIEISAGDTVTWTNNDSAQHTVTQSPSGSGFTSGALSQGGTFSQTFDTPGEYPYFCEFHANMSGTVIVS